MITPKKLGAVEAAVFETVVAPSYLSAFAGPLLELLVSGRSPRLVHLLCRTGYPDAALAERLPGVQIFGSDPSEAAVALARAKASAQGVAADYRVAASLPLPYPDGAFTHALCLHPLAAAESRRRVLAELARLVAPRGQGLVALPLRGSFEELTDLLREFALKRERPELDGALARAAEARPTEAELEDDLRRAGFDRVTARVERRSLHFASGRDFVDDPTVRLVLVPELRQLSGETRLDDALAYVREAVDTYFKDGAFSVGFTVGCVAGRRAAWSAAPAP